MGVYRKVPRSRGALHPRPPSEGALFSWTDAVTWQRLVNATPVPCTVETLRARLETVFEALLVYHAARPTTVIAYYERGLLLGSHAEQKARARDIFLSGEFPELTEEHLDAAETRILPVDDGCAFVSLDPAGFLEYAGHYLIYGSEYLCGLAANLNNANGRDYRQVLKRLGIPTVFCLRLPFDAISESDFKNFAHVVHEQLPRARRRLSVPEIDFTFRLRQPLPPECVLEHFHPKRVMDPLLGMIPYHYAGDKRPHLVRRRTSP